MGPLAIVCALLWSLLMMDCCSLSGGERERALCGPEQGPTGDERERAFRSDERGRDVTGEQGCVTRFRRADFPSVTHELRHYESEGKRREASK
ncbi:hypothetical protein AVEN_217364-1 [Araneus ventricosus]|uniref:Secreted protein n=1 Tax=Araneus ventricosus TaxID=182803 RepID=A0A4Y2S2Z2_ARAVE|nr:hypothetical protein AVEN_217364-1 [Araneus ventricosus]